MNILTRLIVYLVFSFFLFFQSSCYSFNVPPNSLPDYNNSDGFILDYGVGDCFETLKPMILTRPLKKGLSLTKPGIGSPSLEQYAANPNEFGYVVKVIPTGTRLSLVALKDGGNSSLTYFTLSGINEWVCVHLSEFTKIGIQHHLRFNREYFKKAQPPCP